MKYVVVAVVFALWLIEPWSSRHAELAEYPELVPPVRRVLHQFWSLWVVSAVTIVVIVSMSALRNG